MSGYGVDRAADERDERRYYTGIEDGWNDETNPDYLDQSDDATAFPQLPTPVSLAKPDTPWCRKGRRLGWSANSWGRCPGRILDGRCTLCGPR